MQQITEKGKKFQEVTVFSGSPPEDIEHAKSFWKSLTLQPPLESRLVSAEIRQRMRVAPPPSRSKQVRDFLNKKDQELQELIKESKKIEQEEERQRYEKLARKREEALCLLEKQRSERLAKEMIRDKVRLHHSNCYSFS